MSRHGLDAIALEIGTEAARFAQSTLGRPNRVELMQALQRKYPDSIAIVSDKQENDLLEHCFESAKQSGFQVWGLDQEFAGGCRLADPDYDRQWLWAQNDSSSRNHAERRKGVCR